MPQSPSEWYQSTKSQIEKNPWSIMTSAPNFDTDNFSKTFRVEEGQRCEDLNGDKIPFRHKGDSFGERLRTYAYRNEGNPFIDALNGADARVVGAEISNRTNDGGTIQVEFERGGRIFFAKFKVADDSTFNNFVNGYYIPSDYARGEKYRTWMPFTRANREFDKHGYRFKDKTENPIVTIDSTNITGDTIVRTIEDDKRDTRLVRTHINGKPARVAMGGGVVPADNNNIITPEDTPTNVSHSEQPTEHELGMFSYLENFLNSRAGMITVGMLIAAGLYGIYYLYTRWKSNNKITAEDRMKAIQIEKIKDNV